MKPPHHRSSYLYRVTPVSAASSRYRRYPSLSDDGQPYFTWWRRNKRATEKPDVAVPAPAAHGRNKPILSVRFIALLAITAIFVALVAYA